MSDEKKTNNEETETTTNGASEPTAEEKKTEKKRRGRPPKKKTAETAIAPVQTPAIERGNQQTPAPRPNPAPSPFAQTPFSDRGGISLSNMSDAWVFAKTFVKSGFAPKGIETPEAALIALQMGAELGLPPMASLQNIAVINGRPSVWGDAMLAVCRASGIFDEEAFIETISQDPETGELSACCTVRRLPNGNLVVREFTMLDAKTAGLTSKSGPWQQYPKRMLQMRARSWALKDAFADVLRGFHVAEEAMDMPAPNQPPAERRSVEQLDHLTASLAKKDNAVATVVPKQDVDDAPPAEPESDDPRHFELEPTV
jgi:hypothetical protein